MTAATQINRFIYLGRESNWKETINGEINSIQNSSKFYQSIRGILWNTEIPESCKAMAYKINFNIYCVLEQLTVQLPVVTQAIDVSLSSPPLFHCMPLHCLLLYVAAVVSLYTLFRFCTHGRTLCASVSQWDKTSLNCLLDFTTTVLSGQSPCRNFWLAAWAGQFGNKLQAYTPSPCPGHNDTLN